MYITCTFWGGTSAIWEKLSQQPICVSLQKQSREVFYKKLSLKISQYSQKNTCWSLFIKVAGLQACNFIKKRLQWRCFPANIVDFSKTPILKNICKRLLLHLTLHKKWSFLLRISSVNVTKSADFCGFGHIYWRNPQWKTSFFVQCKAWFSLKEILLPSWINYY